MLWVSVPNPDDANDMPIYEGDPEKCATLEPGVYPATATYVFAPDADGMIPDDVEESGYLITAGYVMEGVKVERPFYLSPDACTYGPFWCRNENPHTHTGAFWA